MWPFHRWPPSRGRVFRGSKLIDRDFQLRYTLLVVAGTTLGTVLAMVPIYFFLNQNYQIFYSLAVSEAPGLLQALEREQTWINTVLFSTLFGLIIFFAILGLRLTSRIVGPLRVLRNHLKQLCRGNFHQSPIKVRDNDEFQDLIEAYNYYYNSQRQSLKRDLERLNQLAVDPKNRDAYTAWKAMIAEKSMQIQAQDPERPIPIRVPKSEGTHATQKTNRANSA